MPKKQVDHTIVVEEDDVTVDLVERWQKRHARRIRRHAWKQILLGARVGKRVMDIFRRMDEMREDDTTDCATV